MLDIGNGMGSILFIYDKKIHCIFLPKMNALRQHFHGEGSSIKIF